MSISKEKKRVIITVPKDKLKDFKKFAIDEEITLSEFLVTAGTNVYNQKKKASNPLSALGEQEIKSQLEKELKFYENNKKKLLKQFENKFVLIKNSELAGIFDNAENAYDEGLKKFGNSPMFIKKVTTDEPAPCR